MIIIRQFLIFIMHDSPSLRALLGFVWVKMLFANSIFANNKLFYQKHFYKESFSFWIINQRRLLIVILKMYYRTKK